MPCCICQNSVIIGSIKDPSGRKVVITQAFAFMTIFLHPGGQRPASIHECGLMPLANCLWQMPLANAVQNTSAMANSPPAPDPNSKIPAVLQGPNCRCISFAVLANLRKRAHSHGSRGDFGDPRTPTTRARAPSNGPTHFNNSFKIPARHCALAQTIFDFNHEGAVTTTRVLIANHEGAEQCVSTTGVLTIQGCSGIAGEN